MRRHAKGTALLERPGPVKIEAPLRIVHPAQDETVVGPGYTLQIAAKEDAAAVELCFDHGDWLPCREALGLWWHDWAGFDPGEHVVVARMRRKDDTLALSEPRLFFAKAA